jgi:hypothetical protein
MRPAPSILLRRFWPFALAAPLAMACAQSAVTGDDGEVAEPPLDADVPLLETGAQTNDDSGPAPQVDAGTDAKDAGRDVVAPVDTGIADAGIDAPACGKIVINELMSQGASASDEFVELYNPNACTVALNGYKLNYSSAAGSTPSAILSFTAAHSIPAGGYLVLVGSGFAGDAGVTAIQTSVGLAAASGRVGLVDPTSKVVDAVSYGAITGPTTYVETAAAPSPPTGKSIGRKPNGTDTDNNAADLQILTAPTPGLAN